MFIILVTIYGLFGLGEGEMTALNFTADHFSIDHNPFIGNSKSCSTCTLYVFIVMCVYRHGYQLKLYHSCHL